MKSLRERLCEPTAYERKKIEVKSTIDVDMIVEHWESKGLKKVGSSTLAAKTTVDSIKKLKKGTLFNSYSKFSDYHNRKFSMQEIMDTIDAFAFAAFDANYEPTDKIKLQKLPLHQFIFNPYVPKLKSPFLKYYENPPEPTIKDENERLTKCIYQLYRKVVLGGSETINPTKEQTKFILASKRLKEFFDRNRNKIHAGYAVNNLTMAQWLLESITRETKLAQICAGFFCSNETFSRRLPQYLHSEGIIR